MQWCSTSDSGQSDSIAARSEGTFNNHMHILLLCLGASSIAEVGMMDLNIEMMCKVKFSTLYMAIFVCHWLGHHPD